MNGNICRICFEEDLESNLVWPCHCKGSIHNVHPYCLKEWLKSKGNNTCEICQSIFPIKLSYPSFSTMLYKLISELWRDKKRILKLALIFACGQFMLKSVLRLRKIGIVGNHKSILFGLGTITGLIFSQVAYIFLKEIVNIVTDINQTIKGTVYIIIDNKYY